MTPWSTTMQSLRPGATLSRRTYLYAEAPPAAKQVEDTIESFGRAKVIYKDPHYSNPTDVPRRDREYGGKRFRLRGTTLRYLPDFRHHSSGTSSRSACPEPAQKFARTSVQTWEFSAAPPSRRDAMAWLEQRRPSLFSHAPAILLTLKIHCRS